MNYPLIATALYTMGPDLCARCFAFLDEEHMDGIISEPGSRPHRSMLERILAIAALGEKPPSDINEAGAREKWESSVESVFASAHVDPEALTARLLSDGFRAMPPGELAYASPAELIQYDNIIERLAMGPDARSEQVRVREWIGFVAETGNLKRVRGLTTLEGHALEFIFRAAGSGYSDELLIRDAVLDQDLGLPDYPAEPPPWLREMENEISANSEGGVIRLRTADS